MPRRLAPDKYFILASPKYIERNGPPLAPNDLAHHNCLVLGENSAWRFSNGNSDLTVRVNGTLSSNSTEMLIEAALYGLGIVRISRMKTNDLILTGQVVRVLEEYDVAGDTAIWALFPSSRHISPKLRVFLDFFAEKFRRRESDSAILIPHIAAAE